MRHIIIFIIPGATTNDYLLLIDRSIIFAINPLVDYSKLNTFGLWKVSQIKQHI